jgi:hypothetical protein
MGASLTDDNLDKIVIAKQPSINYSINEINKIRLNEIMSAIFSDQNHHYLLKFHKNEYKRINSD